MGNSYMVLKIRSLRVRDVKMFEKEGGRECPWMISNED